jgi:hypothetical protein
LEENSAQKGRQRAIFQIGMNFRSESIDTVDQLFMVAAIPLEPQTNVSPESV